MPFSLVSYGLSDAGRSGRAKVPPSWSVCRVKVKKRFSGRGITGRQFWSTPHILWVEEKGQSVGRACTKALTPLSTPHDRSLADFYSRVCRFHTPGLTHLFSLIDSLIVFC